MNVHDKNWIIPTTFGVDYRLKNPFFNFGDKYTQEYNFPIVRSFDQFHTKKEAVSRGMSVICSGPTHYTITFMRDERYSVPSQGCRNIKRSNAFHSNSERWPSPPGPESSGTHDRLLRGNDKTQDRGFHGGEYWNRGFPGCGPAHIRTNVSEGPGASIFRAYMYRYGCIGGTCCLHIQGRKAQIQTFWRNLLFPVFYIDDGGRMFLGKFG